MATTYEDTDIDRFSRKVTKLLAEHDGKDFFSILKERTRIKDEFCSLLDLSNHRLEEYIDKALYE
ncbi:MAG: hypothetical protein ACOCZV_02730 [Nanoarchaeota archaeon]